MPPARRSRRSAERRCSAPSSQRAALLPSHRAPPPFSQPAPPSSLSPVVRAAIVLPACTGPNSPVARVLISDLNIGVVVITEQAIAGGGADELHCLSSHGPRSLLGSTSSEPLHHEETRAIMIGLNICRKSVRTKSSRLNPGSVEVTSDTLETAQEDIVAPLAALLA
ncbi:hypothetical protein BRADI_1g64012v3 [Brachypodium distachyon]|uniref:Uncharacterized protein n=1 Tax=Brachypodium distachyon TaxID=15368 RepID=A0A2K2DTB4_BRADI|nr:hypothetical protein BRADI_1g64012v3 [Brachypodium distachyon]